MNAVVALDAHVKAHASMYEPGVLRPEKHYRLVDALGKVCEKAGVRPEFIAHSATEHCTESEVNWIRNVRHNPDNGISGLLYVKQDQVEARMMALAGACLRNFIHVRVMTLGDVLSEQSKGGYDEPTVLCIPNFCMTAKEYQLSQWDASTVYDLLLHRYTRSLQTVLACYDLPTVEKIFGPSCKAHLENYYKKVN